MSTGPEHYTEAERLLGLVMETQRVREGDVENLAAAQVHATLALAAATALGAQRANGQAAFSPGQYGDPAPKRMPTAQELVDGIRP